VLCIPQLSTTSTDSAASIDTATIVTNNNINIEHFCLFIIKSEDIGIEGKILGWILGKWAGVCGLDSSSSE